jgi:hypothetical protein
MAIRILLVRLILCSAIMVFGCQQKDPDIQNWPYSKERPDWPSDVIASLWIPQAAREVRYYTRPDNYQITSEVDICLPASELIDEMVDYMVRKNWKRLETDFLNPHLNDKPNYARPYESLWMKWGHYYAQDGAEVYQWIDDWQDAKGNIVRYGLRYKSRPKVKIEKCVCDVSAIYIPVEIIKKLEPLIRNRR